MSRFPSKKVPDTRIPTLYNSAKNILDPKHFGSKIFLFPKKFWVQKKICDKIMFGYKKFVGHENFWVKKLFGPRQNPR